MEAGTGMQAGTGWVSIDEVSDEIQSEPWRLYWREWKSGEPDFERFLHEPLAVLRDDMADVEPDWHVTTQVLNHEHGLAIHAVCTLAIVMPDHKMAHVLLYKHPPE